MLDDLDSSLQQLLLQELPDLQRSTETALGICFDPPLEGLIRQKPAINLFLYDVRENLKIVRNAEWSVERRIEWDGGEEKTPRSHRLLLYGDGVDQHRRPQQEHHLLGQLMRLLLTYRTLPEAVLQGSLKGQEPLPVATGLRSNYLQSLGEFWQAMGGRPKVALS
jgi:hypothetical protein